MSAAIRRSFRRPFTRHDARDINCIRWDVRRNDRSATCRPCVKTGGYVAQRHAETSEPS